MLIGLGKMIKKIGSIPSALTLLASKILGYTHVTVPGGSGYYTTTVGENKEGLVVMSMNGYTMHSTDGITWTIDSTIGAPEAWNNYWTNLVYGNGIWLATNDFGYLGYSKDGINWTKRTNFSPIVKLYFLNNKFLMIFTSGVKYSTDGITWTVGGALPNVSNGWRGITYGDKYVAIGYNSEVAYSNDLLTWTESTQSPLYSNTYNWITDPVYANNKYVVAGPYGQILYSYDGITWSEAMHDYDGQTQSKVYYINGKFIVLAGFRHFYSTDGITWTVGTTLSNRVLHTTDIVYGNGIYIYFGIREVEGGGQQQGAFVTSTDGINWTDSGTVQPGAGGVSNLIFFNNRFICGGEGGFFGVSTDGAYWTVGRLRDEFYFSARGIVKGIISTLKEIQTAIGNQGETGAEILAPVDVYTVPALTLTRLKKVETKNLSNNTITYDLAIMPSNQELSQYWSYKWDTPISAGATDTILPDPSMDPLYSWITMYEGYSVKVLPSAVDSVSVKVYGDEVKVPVFVAGTPSSGKSNIYSTDGITWKTGTGLGAVNIVYANNIFVGGSFSGQVWSEDAINWTLSPTNFGHTMCMYGDKFLSWNSTGGYTGLMYSANGKTWTKVNNGLDYKSIMYINGKYFASLYNGNEFATSTDGISWTTITLDKNLGIYQPYFAEPKKNFTYGNGKYVIAGNMSYSYSSDAVSWTTLDMWFLQPGQSIVSIEFFNNKFYVGGPNLYARSDDGVTWTLLDSETSIIHNVIDNKMFVSKADSLKYTTDGTNFTTISVPGVSYTGSPYGIRYGNGLYVVLGQNNAAYVSSDLSTWTLASIQGDSVAYMVLANRP